MNTRSGMSQSSKTKLSTCSINLQRVVNKIAEAERVQVIEGRRSKERQRELVLKKKSKTLDSKHVTDGPSLAVDIAPLNSEGEIEWTNEQAFYAFGERVLAVAKSMNIKLRWGGDWDGDGDYRDQTFNDLVHFEEA